MKLLRFTAKWCAPCHVFAPILEAFAKSHKVAIQIIDCTNPGRREDAAAEKYSVMVLPTTVLVDHEGKALATIAGAETRAVLDVRLRGLIGDEKVLERAAKTGKRARHHPRTAHRRSGR